MTIFQRIFFLEEIQLYLSRRHNPIAEATERYQKEYIACRQYTEFFPLGVLFAVLQHIEIHNIHNRVPKPEMKSCHLLSTKGNLYRKKLLYLRGKPLY